MEYFHIIHNTDNNKGITSHFTPNYENNRRWEQLRGGWGVDSHIIDNAVK